MKMKNRLINKLDKQPPVEEPNTDSPPIPEEFPKEDIPSEIPDIKIREDAKNLKNTEYFY